VGISLNHGKIYGYAEAVDMRKGFSGLVTITQENLKLDPLSGDLFVFSNRSGKILK